MSRMKNLAIDQANNAPRYEVAILVADGPDDVTLECQDSFTGYMDAIKYATELHDKGHCVKIFDPYVNTTYSFPKDF
jgi:hypothetical protein